VLVVQEKQMLTYGRKLKNKKLRKERKNETLKKF